MLFFNLLYNLLHLSPAVASQRCQALVKSAIFVNIAETVSEEKVNQPAAEDFVQLQRHLWPSVSKSLCAFLFYKLKLWSQWSNSGDCREIPQEKKTHLQEDPVLRKRI